MKRGPRTQTPVQWVLLFFHPAFTTDPLSFWQNPHSVHGPVPNAELEPGLSTTATGTLLSGALTGGCDIVLVRGGI